MSEEDDLFASGGEASQFIRYAPQSKKWKSNGEELSIQQIALDFSTLKPGWGIWPEGQAITWTFGSKPSVLPEKPSDQHKQGFHIEAYIPEDKTMVKKTWSSMTFGERETIKLMYRQVKDQVKANPNKIAVYSFDGASENMKVGAGNTNYAKCTFKGFSDKPDAEVEDTSNDDPIFDID